MATWMFSVGPHRFLVNADQVAATARIDAWASVPHAPAWALGLTEVQGRWVLGIDAAKFLGIDLPPDASSDAAPLPMQLLLPNRPERGDGAPAPATDWGLCVAHCEPGPDPEALIAPPPGVESPTVEPGALPGFIGEWLWWQVGDDWHWAQALDLHACLRHPRLLEALQ